MVMKLDMKQLICDKLIELIEQTPLHKIKVVDLCKQARIGRSTFYQYFDSVYDAVQHIEDRFLKGFPSEESISLDRIFARESSDKGHPVTRERMAYWTDNAHILRALLGENGDPAFQMRIANRFWRVTKRNFEPGSHLSESELRAFSSYIAGGWGEVLSRWARSDPETNLEDQLALSNKISLHVLKMLQKECS